MRQELPPALLFPVMRRCGMALLLLLLLLLQCLQAHGQSIDGSLRGDMAALLSFKGGLLVSSNKLSSWRASSARAPCDWRGVTCLSGRVGKLNLQRMNLGGPIPDLGKLDALVRLSIHSNAFNGTLPLSITKLPNLRVMYAHNNEIGGIIPSAVGGMARLQLLNIANNRLTGGIPSTLANLTSLRTLDLSINMLSGVIPWQLSRCVRLRRLDLSRNRLSGGIPAEFRELQLRFLEYLNLSHNSLSAAIPAQLSGCTSLKVLDLHSNALTGPVPPELGLLYNLEVLMLGENRLSSDIPPEVEFLTELVNLSLASNKISGRIPSELSNCRRLELLDLASNSISGTVPSWLGTLDRLQVLNLSDNSLSGELPGALSGSLRLEVVDLGHNNLRGPIPADLGALIKLERLDLQQNRLSGSIPETLVACTRLAYLQLRGNSLSGPIPAALAHLQRLQLADLSSNELTGSIPAGIASIASLVTFNVSYNNLEGKLPAPLLAKFGPASFANNPRLCLVGSCGSGNKLRIPVAVVAATAAALVVVLLLVLLLAVLLVLVRRSRPPPSPGTSFQKKDSSTAPVRDSLVLFSDPIPYSAVVEATRNFDEEHVLLRSNREVVFKACLEDGSVLSVKQLLLDVVNEAVFRGEAERLAALKHKNLLVLRGYYYGNHVKLLVYDYMPNGNLDLLLQQASRQDGSILDWRMRHLIALNVARGLQYLHLHTLVHGQVRPVNVHFDADFEPHLADFGTSRLLLRADESSGATQELDVCSFGVLLLELLTGRKPAEFGDEAESMVKWIKQQLQLQQQQQQEAACAIFDPSLLDLVEQESSEWEELLLAVKIALLCTATDPSDRPSMTEVVFMLEGCRPNTAAPTLATTSSEYTSPL